MEDTTAQQIEALEKLAAVRLEHIQVLKDHSAHMFNFSVVGWAIAAGLLFTLVLVK